MMKPAQYSNMKCRGLSMIELMIAMTLSLILLAGVIQVFLSNKVTYILQEGVSRVQENGRYVTEVMARDIRMAGYSGCRNMDRIPVNIIADNASDFEGFFSTSVAGLNDVGAGNGYGAKNGTDILIMSGASPSTVRLTGNMTAMNANIQLGGNPDDFEAGDVLFITDCQQADVFRATNVSEGGKVTIAHSNAMNTTNFLSKAYDDRAMVMRMNQDAYYIADSGNSNEQGDPIISLYTQNVAGNTFELVEGVEDMQITYGEDINGDDYLADIYRDADAVTDWSRVVSVRLSLLLNSVEDVGGNERPYQFQGVSVTSPGDNKLRREFTTTIHMRNRTLMQ